MWQGILVVQFITKNILEHVSVSIQKLGLDIEKMKNLSAIE